MAEFEIEKVFEIASRGWFAMARALDGACGVDGGPGFLGAVAVDGGTVPRKFDGKGTPRTDIWIFRLADGADPRLCVQGEVVAWTSRGAASR